MERLLNSITGRPTGIEEKVCSAPLPLPFDEDELKTEKGKAAVAQYNEETPVRTLLQHELDPSYIRQRTPARPAEVYLQRRILLAALTQRALEQMYSPSAMTKSWHETQDSMKDFLRQLDDWRDTLPDGLNFRKRPDGTVHPRLIRSLASSYYSCRIIITRPCLCRLDRRIVNQSDASTRLNVELAADCVRAAEAIAALVTDDMDRYEVFRVGPWYCQIHFLMQALSVLMLELSFQCVHMKKGENVDVKRTIKKLIATLRMLSVDHRPAERAWRMALELMEKAAPSLEFDMSDVKRYPPTSVTPPPTSVPSSHATRRTDGIPNFAPPPSNISFADQNEDDVMWAAQPFYDPFAQPVQQQHQQQPYGTDGALFDPFVNPSSASSENAYFGFNMQPGTSGMDMRSNMGLSTAYDEAWFYGY